MKSNRHKIQKPLILILLALFIAYLIHLSSEKAFRVDFYTDLNRLGFDASFAKHFGKDPESLNSDFDLFLNKGLAEGLKIIP